MELSAFSENIVKESFRRGDQVLEVHVNIDVVTPEFLDAMQARLEALNKSAQLLAKKVSKKIASTKRSESDDSGFALEKEMLILQREAHASFLCDPIPLPDGSTTSLLRGWDMTDKGESVACTKANVCRLPPKGVEALAQFCLRIARTVKKNPSAGEETSEATQDGSPALKLVGQST